jgi:chitinase
MVPWLYNGKVFISYDDAVSMALKADYISTKGLGGAAVWELSQDPNKVLLNSLYDNLNK